MLITKITATQNEVALNYCNMRGLYFLAVIFAATIQKTDINMYYGDIIRWHNDVTLSPQYKPIYFRIPYFNILSLYRA